MTTRVFDTLLLLRMHINLKIMHAIMARKLFEDYRDVGKEKKRNIRGISREQMGRARRLSCQIAA